MKHLAASASGLVLMAAVATSTGCSTEADHLPHYCVPAPAAVTSAVTAVLPGDWGPVAHVMAVQAPEGWYVGTAGDTNHAAVWFTPDLDRPVLRSVESVSRRVSTAPSGEGSSNGLAVRHVNACVYDATIIDLHRRDIR